MIKKSSAHKSEVKKWHCFLKKNGYSEAAMKTAAPKLEELDPDLKEALKRWDEIGELPVVEIEGFTVQGLTEFKGLHVIAAFLMMDWLLKDPDEAKEALAEPIESLVITDELCDKMEFYEEAEGAESRPEAEKP